MRFQFKNNKIEAVMIAANVLMSLVCIASFVLLFGFYEPLLPVQLLYLAQIFLLAGFTCEKVIRYFNAASKREFIGANWFEVPLFIGLMVALFGAGRYFAYEQPEWLRHFAIGVYVIVQVVVKICRTVVNLAASGRNPTRTLIFTFMGLILFGAGTLMLPRCSTHEPLGFVDALFTSTSATCVTGLIVKDTGSDFTMMGQIVILGLIQLGGLGIIIFGAVFALLLGQALSVKESVAMQDLLSEQTVGSIGKMIVFIFTVTVLIEAAGALAMFSMWDNVPMWNTTGHRQWFCTIFHSISAFCNAGFSLFPDSLISYRSYNQVYTVICPLIILGGLGFSVLYNLFVFFTDRVMRVLRSSVDKEYRFLKEAPKRMRLQSKIVMTVSAILIVAGTGLILLVEYFAGHGSGAEGGILGAFFQSVTSRTAGFNTVDIGKLSEASRLIIIILMFIGGSPGSATGGIKTVTIAVIVMTVVAACRKRPEVEIFNRSIRLDLVGRAITVTLLFLLVLFTATFALTVTESGSDFTLGEIGFEAASALGTVGLSTGITPALTLAGKLIIIVIMLIGRLGPLTLLAALTFNLKPVPYSYPDEAVIVG